MSLDHPPITEEFRNAAEHSPLRRAASKIPPFSLRLSAEEKIELLRRAGNIPLAAYIRSQLLGNTAAPRRKQRRLVKDEQALSRLLSELGKGRLAGNLNQLAKAANTGFLPVTSDTEQAFIQASRDVRWMRDTLIAALGLRVGP